ncbi:MAG: LacI family DNA-binding transcriptional regulator [Algoriphagus sp.]|uniref:LacI family DNA-binding transcriptional regulator n=1 Tax=Algoriphagus sp. TaxID=1872435 RepID=UPI0017CA1697|nr:LacI family DNA-binding transcriptional regulator [Algoriphagus sp.]NVJ85287.1 LacI family DNA-binding transcriptional regulator [Algoriphagus sp.]
MAEKRRITLKDIARELGISVSTASRALNSYPGISEETIQMVQEFAKKHNYVPNSIAVNFRKNKTMTIGMVVPEVVHYYFSSIISGALQAANLKGYRLLISQTQEKAEQELHACHGMLAGNVDGLLISISNETSDVSHLQEFLDEGKPVVQFDKYSDQLTTPKVITDDFQSAYRAVKHLIDQGCKKIAHINGLEQVQNSKDRLGGYLKVLSDHNLEQNPEWIPHCQDISEAEGYAYAKQLMESSNPPDAIFCITDLVALGVMNYLRDAKIRVPEEVSVMGFSNWKISEVMQPSLSTVEQHGFLIGQKAMDLLIESLQSTDKASSNKVIEVPSDLIIRKSTLKKG